MASYKEIRRHYQPHDRWCPSLIDHYAYLISPLFTRIFVKAGIVPNTVTVLMIAAGVIGAILFAGPQLWLKVYGLLFLHLWYVLDCSDGEVARITGTFSKFGKEMDYTAHLVNHPLFNLAFASSLASLEPSNLRLILFVAILSISAELVLRHLLSLQGIYEVKMGVTIGARGKRGMFTKSLLLVVGFLHLHQFCSSVSRRLFCRLLLRHLDFSVLLLDPDSDVHPGGRKGSLQVDRKDPDRWISVCGPVWECFETL
jgi:phosphatidylglycerophosphate synthase